MMSQAWYVHDVEQTQQLGRLIGKHCEPGDVIALNGDLGAGKTTLVQAIAQGAGVDADEYVCSPSFALLHEYHGRIPLYHLDLYRLNSADEVRAAGLDDYFYRSGVALVEWPDRAPLLIPGESLVITLEVQGETDRRVVLSTRGSSWRQRLASVIAAMQAGQQFR